MKVAKLEQTCGACPEQYSGELETGEEIYIRCRWGYGYLDINGNTVADVTYEGDGFRGTFDEGDVAKLFRDAGIEWDGTFTYREW